MYRCLLRRPPSPHCHHHYGAVSRYLELGGVFSQQQQQLRRRVVRGVCGGGSSWNFSTTTTTKTATTTTMMMISTSGSAANQRRQTHGYHTRKTGFTSTTNPFQAAAPAAAARTTLPTLGSVVMNQRNKNKTNVVVSNFQCRSYLFFPTSWTEWRIRLRENHQAQIVKVKLWRDRTREARKRVVKAGYKYYRLKLLDRGRAFRDRGVEWIRSRYQMQKNKWRHYYARRIMERRLARMTTTAATTTATTTIPAPLATIPVPIKEYSKPCWFDEAGRPITSRDETDRFVNPWMSRSTDGVHTFKTLFRWRWRRLQREWNQYGWDMFRPTFFLSSSSSNQQQDVDSNNNHHHQPKTNFPTATTLDPSVLRCTWIGHATCWVQQGPSFNLLTDPIFSQRASPFQNAPIGVARDIPPAFSIHPDLDYVTFDVCLISHDHYDHLDLSSIVALRDKVKTWIVPLGIGTWLQKNANILPQRIVELSWWESVLLRRQDEDDHEWVVTQRHSLQAHSQGAFCTHPSLVSLEDNNKDDPQQQQHQPATSNQIWITALPTQHWAGRTLLDRNRRLWASFAVFLDHDQLFYFAGDTALPTEFPLFEQIADYIGHPTLSAIPIGAYAPRYLNQEAHLDPLEAIQVHVKLGSQQSMAIHHSTFPLGEEPKAEPIQLLQQAAAAANIKFDVVPHGGSVSVGAKALCPV